MKALVHRLVSFASNQCPQGCEVKTLAIAMLSEFEAREAELKEKHEEDLRIIAALESSLDCRGRR